MRSFIAVPFAESVKGTYRNLYEEGRALHPFLRWVRPENIHLTLRFLGETPPEVVGPLREEVAREVGSEPSFPLTIGAPGHFTGRGGFPRVLWFGIDEGGTPLERIARGVERAARRCGFARERRPFRPHLTVARSPARASRPLASGDWGRLGSDCGLAGMTMKVENVALLESTLRAGGPLYSLVWEAPLGASGSLENDDKE